MDIREHRELSHTITQIVMDAALLEFFCLFFVAEMGRPLFSDVLVVDPCTGRGLDLIALGFLTVLQCLTMWSS